MATTHVYAGTARSMGATAGGIFRQAAGDNRWEHLTNGVPEDADVHAITVHPENPDVVYVGSTKGAYRSTNRGNTWERLRLPEDADIWSVCIHPKNPRVRLCRRDAPGCLSQRRRRRHLAQDGRPWPSRPGHHGFRVPGDAARCRSQFAR